MEVFMRNGFVYRFCLRSIAALLLCSIGIPKAAAEEGEREYVPFVEEGKV